MAKIAKKDFVEIEYTGRLKEGNVIFDTTDEKLAKDNSIFSEQQNYGAIKVMIGANQVLPGLDRFMVGKEPGQFKVELKAEDAFGKKDPKLLKLLPKNVFIKQGINPMPSMPINMDGINGIIKTVSGGRCIVDFNHPLAGKDLEYDLKINRIVTDEKEKVEAIISLQLKKDRFDVSIEGENATIDIKDKIAKELKSLIADMINKFTKIKKIEFKESHNKA